METEVVDGFVEFCLAFRLYWEDRESESKKSRTNEAPMLKTISTTNKISIQNDDTNCRSSSMEEPSLSEVNIIKDFMEPMKQKKRRRNRKNYIKGEKKIEEKVHESNDSKPLEMKTTLMGADYDTEENREEIMELFLEASGKRAREKQFKEKRARNKKAKRHRFMEREGRYMKSQEEKQEKKLELIEVQETTNVVTDESKEDSDRQDNISLPPPNSSPEPPAMQGTPTTNEGTEPILENVEKQETLESVQYRDKDSDSPSQREWNRQKREGSVNEAIDKIMDLIGLDEVKARVLKMKSLAEAAKRQGVDISMDRYSVALVGNPGTGKTTFARLYAQFLLSIQVTSGKGFVESKARKLSHIDGVKGISTVLENLGDSKGGIFFIDDAPQLIPHTGILDHLLGEIESYRGKVIFMFSGYKDKMEAFLGYNPSVRSRIPHVINFDDYSEKELLQFLRRFIEARFDKRMQIEGGLEGPYPRILVRRLCSQKGKEVFRNAQAVEDILSQVLERQANRLLHERTDGKKPDDFYLSKEDLIGPEPANALEKSSAWKQLQRLVGLQKLKAAVKALSDRVQENHQRVLEGNEPAPIILSRVILGPPGTGKTTVAKLYGQLLFDLGLLSNGEVVIKTPADLIAKYLGQTEANTTSILASAMGKVLIIDEAHTLYPGQGSGTNNSYRLAAIDTLVAQTQNREDQCVILVGHTQPILDMFRHTNPGLARHFPLEDDFTFTNFNIDQLTQMLDEKVRSQGLKMNETARTVAIQLLRLAQDRPNFRNGGEVETIIDRAKTAHQKRIPYDASVSIDHKSTFEPQDFDANYHRIIDMGSSCRGIFQGMVGCEEMIEQFEGYQQIVEGMRRFGRDPRPHIPFTFIFKGPPGTGKTTTARRVGQIFYDMGFLSAPNVVECSVSDMIGEYLGQTGPKVINIFELALGKVLFIDEAYRLGKGNYHKEATAELVGCITKERYMNKMIIILAGYEEEMNNLLNSNMGLGSRFSTEVLFRNMPPEHGLTLLKQRIGELDVVIEGLDGKIPSEKSKIMVILRLFVNLAATASWGNGRDVETLAKSVIGHAFRFPSSGDSVDAGLSVPFEVLHVLMKQMLEQKKGRATTRPGFGRFHAFRQMKPSAEGEGAPPSLAALLPNSVTMSSEHTIEHGYHEV